MYQEFLILVIMFTNLLKFYIVGLFQTRQAVCLGSWELTIGE